MFNDFKLPFFLLSNCFMSGMYICESDLESVNSFFSLSKFSRSIVMKLCWRTTSSLHYPKSVYQFPSRCSSCTRCFSFRASLAARSSTRSVSSRSAFSFRSISFVNSSNPCIYSLSSNFSVILSYRSWPISSRSAVIASRSVVSKASFLAISLRICSIR